MAKQKEEQMIFLNDKTILPWERPVPEGSVSMLKLYRASTKPKEFHGPAVLKTIVGPYVVSASAMVYTADIARKIGSDKEFEGPKYNPKEEILFIGSIQIINNRDTIMINGYVLNGRIWYAKEMPKINVLETGLLSIILNNELKPERQIAMLDMIVRGYEFQEKKEEERRRFNEDLTRGWWD